MGAVILPPMPAFYNRPKDLDDIVNHTVARVLDRLQLPQTLVGEWQGGQPVAAPGPPVVDLSVVIPVYDEEENLPQLWAELRERAGAARAWPSRSCSSTTGAATGAPRSSAASATPIRACGWCGSRPTPARPRPPTPDSRRRAGTWVVTMDADLQNDPHDIPTLLSHLDRWDAVTGWRVKRGEGDSSCGAISSRIANRVRNWLSRRDHPGQRLHLPRVPARVPARARALPRLSPLHPHAPARCAATA